VTVIIPARNEASNTGDADGAELPLFIDAMVAGATPAKRSRVAV
jgi:hypothetical protein